MIANQFRKILITMGKFIPFIFAFIVVVGYSETIHAVINQLTIIDMEGDYYYLRPVSEFIGNYIYIDWFDVFILYILAFALEYCKYNLRAVHYVALNLIVRTVVERFVLDDWVIILISAIMALCGLYCIYGGFKILLSK